MKARENGREQKRYATTLNCHFNKNDQYLNYLPQFYSLSLCSSYLKVHSATLRRLHTSGNCCSMSLYLVRCMFTFVIWMPRRTIVF